MLAVEAVASPRSAQLDSHDAVLETPGMSRLWLLNVPPQPTRLLTEPDIDAVVLPRECDVSVGPHASIVGVWSVAAAAAATAAAVEAAAG